MPAGDLLTANYQYEFNGILMGSGTNWIVESIDGLFEMPALVSGDVDRSDTHGEIPGEDWMRGRTILMELKGTFDTGTLMDAAMRDMAKAMRPRTAEAQFMIRRPGAVDKYINCRPKRRVFQSNYTLARGIAAGTVELRATDPLIYDKTAKTVAIAIAAGSTSNSGTATNAGDFETWPKLTIAGAGTNPRISNSTNGNRQVKVDLVMGSGDTLVIDTHPSRRTVLLNGVDRYDVVRTDNQWWEILEDANTITFSRTGTTGTQTLTVEWRDAWQ